MTRRPTFSELVWPSDPGGGNLPSEWASSQCFMILDWTWRAFDALMAKHAPAVDFSQPLEQLERDLVRCHFVEIQLLFASETDGYATVVPQHEWPELESRKSAAAKPPAYDLAFISTANRRWAWPIEAKVLPTSATLAEYLKDVNDKFVAGVASPLHGEGAMIAYLLQKDSTEVFFQNLAAKLEQSLQRASGFAERPHRVTEHVRTSNPNLRLHHLAMACAEPDR